MSKVSIIAELGINHNSSLDLTKQLINAAKVAGCDYVKFQKRTPSLAVPESQRNLIRKTPWGEMTYLEYKERMEFWEKEYNEIDEYCKFIGIKWFASVWDLKSVDFMKQYTDIVKIPSALITNHELLKYSRDNFEFMIISTGMSTEQEVQEAIKIGNPDVVMHTNSSYPSKLEELNLNYIKWLQDKYPSKIFGYSMHNFGLGATFAAVGLGIEWLEFHLTLNREMWGSDQSSSVEPVGAIKLVKGVRDIEKALSIPYGPRKCLGAEKEKRLSLRGV